MHLYFGVYCHMDWFAMFNHMFNNSSFLILSRYSNNLFYVRTANHIIFEAINIY